MAIMIPLMNDATNNPYALMNKFEANPALHDMSQHVTMINERKCHRAQKE